jgi:OmpA-OmpF porin, OOP family
MRKLALSLLVGSMALVPYAAYSQEEAVPTADDFVCALAGDCPDEAEESEVTPAGEPRVSATRGFSLSRTTPSRPKATPSNTRQRSTSQQRTQRTTSAAQQQQQGRVDLRLAFASGSAVLDPADQARLQAFAEALKRPQLANVRVRIEGHTDSSGGRSINQTLSQRRAQAVADFLTSQGIESARLEVRGFGYDRPLPGRRASDGANRRVEAVRIS